MEEKVRVVLLPCDSYDSVLVNEKVKEGFALLKPEKLAANLTDNILIKPNILRGTAPELAVTTHPSVFSAVVRCLREQGYSNITYGDSPGVASGEPDDCSKSCGIADAAEALGIVEGDFSQREVVRHEGVAKKKYSFHLAKAVVEAAAVVSVCKMKTHALETITGAVKNQYGCIQGRYKAAGHVAHPGKWSFAEMLIELNLCIKPKLYIMDGITAMEGNGPGSGDPTPMNLILMSQDPVALDTVFARLVYLEPEDIPTCVKGQELGLGTMDTNRIEVVTPDYCLTVKDAVGLYGNPDFNVPRGKRDEVAAGYSDRPVADLKVCVGCGMCMDACPVEGKAVHSGNGCQAEYDYTKCIRCYCCQEACPVSAITKQNI